MIKAFLLKYRVLSGLALFILAVTLYGWWHSSVFQAGVASDNAKWQVRWSDRDAKDEKAVREALQKQIADADTVRKHNEEIESALNDKDAELAAALHDADTTRRLLAAAARATAPRGGSMSATEDQPTAAAQGTPRVHTGTGNLFVLVRDAIGECRRNADDLDALWSEISPQLWGGSGVASER